MKFHPDVLAAHAEFGGDLEAMQALYDRPDYVARIAELEAENERLREGCQIGSPCARIIAMAQAHTDASKRARQAEALSRTGAVKVDELAQEIRRVDGGNSLGAGALAEALMPFLSALEPAAPEMKTLVHEPMVWTGRGPYGMSPAAPKGEQEAARIGDAVLAWMTKYDLLDGEQEYYVADVIAVLDDLTPLTRPAEQAVTKAGAVRREIKSEMEILRRLADGDQIAFSEDGDCAFFTGGDRAFVGPVIISMRSKSYLKRITLDDENYRGTAERDVISDAGIAALKAAMEASHD